MNQIMVVNFRGAELYGFRLGGNVYVALRPIVEAMGLDWSAQLKRVKRDPILEEGMAMMATPYHLGGIQKSVALRLDLVNGWLFKIDSTRVRAVVREQVLAYQRECYQVLSRHFSEEHAKLLQQDREAEAHRVHMVTEARQTFGPRTAAQLWHKIGLPIVPAMGEPPDQGELPFPERKQDRDAA